MADTALDVLPPSLHKYLEVKEAMAQDPTLAVRMLLDRTRRLKPVGPRGASWAEVAVSACPHAATLVLLRRDLATVELAHEPLVFPALRQHPRQAPLLLNDDWLWRIERRGRPALHEAVRFSSDAASRALTTPRALRVSDAKGRTTLEVISSHWGRSRGPALSSP